MFSRPSILRKSLIAQGTEDNNSHKILETNAGFLRRLCQNHQISSMIIYRGMSKVDSCFGAPKNL